MTASACRFSLSVFFDRGDMLGRVGDFEQDHAVTRKFLLLLGQLFAHAIETLLNAGPEARLLCAEAVIMFRADWCRARC